MIEFDLEYFRELAKDVFTCDSPTGYTKKVIELCKSYVDSFGFDTKVLNNGALEVFIKGADSSKVVATSAHVDTLGLMVRSIKGNGNLALTKLGGPITPTLDGEYCKVYTRDGKIYKGTILSTSPATHVYPDANTKPRDIDNLEVRIDELVHSKEDVVALGIENGDIVCYDPKFEITESGFLKTRFIDDKACAAVLLTAMKSIRKNKVQPKRKIYAYFALYEEIGHGTTWLPEDTKDILAIDIAPTGPEQNSDERKVSIFAKDSRFPYHETMTNEIRKVAIKNKIDYVMDIFTPHYGTDADGSVMAGHDVRHAAIGPGTANSHGYERTHIDGLKNTYLLLMEYLMK